jgi:glycosyltransferase involved in cell wall biosynthesis
VKPGFFAVPGDLDRPTGGYIYARRVLAELDALGNPLQHLGLPGEFPSPGGAALEEAGRLFASLPDEAVVLVDGLAFGILDDLARREADRLRLVALVHHPLALETGISSESAGRLRTSETAALAHSRAVIATSRTTARLLSSGFGVPEERIAIAPPGTDPGPLAQVGHQPTRIVSVGSVIPRKGHDILVDALAAVRDRSWTCSIIGSTSMDRDWFDAVRNRVEALGLDDRVRFLGVRPDVRELMGDADLFVLPSRYEGYGMAFAEALSQGLPVIGCRAGAVPEVVPPSAGILVDPDRPDLLTEALAILLDDPAGLQRYADGAQAAGAELPAWKDTGKIIAQVLEGAKI